MGADVKGYLYYGFPLSEAVTDEQQEAIKQWHRDHEPIRPGNQDYRSPEWDEWRVKRTAYEGTLAYIRSNWSGSEICKQHYIHFASLRKIVEWDEQIQITRSDLEVPHLEADDVLKEFCNFTKIPFSLPKWYLACEYF